MDHLSARRPSAWLLALALALAAMPASAQQGTPEERAKVVAELQAAMSAVQAASTALESSQAKLVAARTNLEAADAARLDAEQRLKASNQRDPHIFQIFIEHIIEQAPALEQHIGQFSVDIIDNNAVGNPPTRGWSQIGYQ